MAPRGLEPRTLRLLAVRSNQLSYETLVNHQLHCNAAFAFCAEDELEANFAFGERKWQKLRAGI